MNSKRCFVLKVLHLSLKEGQLCTCLSQTEKKNFTALNLTQTSKLAEWLAWMSLNRILLGCIIQQILFNINVRMALIRC